MMESYSFQDILIRCTFIFEDVYLKALSLTFSILAVFVFFFAEVPDMVAIVKIRQYKCAIKRLLGFKGYSRLNSSYTSKPALTKFGRSEQYTVNSMVNLIRVDDVDLVDRSYIGLETRLQEK